MTSSQSTSPVRLATAVATLAVALLLTGCAAPAPQTSDAVTASPTPTAPVVVEELGQGEQSGAVGVEIGGPVDVNYRRITIRPGAGTGLHCHYGNLIAIVEKGTLTHYAPIYPEGVHRYTAGDSLTEGADYVHQGKNEGTDDVVLLVTYVTPDGKPLAETDLAKCAPQG